MPMEIKVMDDTECTDNIAFERRIFLTFEKDQFLFLAMRDFLILH
jgi:hypothetical protein